jgi:CheY-like chemotaxis protein
VTHSAVLIVDDEPLVRDTVSELLSGAGLSILEAKNGAEALEVLSCGAAEASYVPSPSTMM